MAHVKLLLSAAGLIACLYVTALAAATYEVGPGKPLASIGAVPWATLSANDTVLIYARPAPYKEKWVICRKGSSGAPITVRGVADSNGNLPIIDGSGAVTAAGLNFWNEERAVIKIGGANTPADTMPEYIIIENLDIRSARAAYSYTGDDGGTHSYIDNAAAITIEKGQNITLRNCILHDCGNGLFVANQSKDILVEGCSIYDNGNVGSAYEHNNYSEATNITFQYNHFGPLRANCDGNNLKDRSAGTVIRYNWIESGNRQLDLVDSDVLNTLPSYSSTFVYGNVLVEPEGAGNSQIVHYGGDGADSNHYRKGTLYFFNNTVVSTRTGNTTLFRLSTAAETADCRNNILYVAAAGSKLAMVEQNGTVNLRSNWLKPGFVNCHGTLSGTINTVAPNTTGTAPGFVNEGSQDFRLLETAAARGIASALAAAALPAHDILNQYVKHQQIQARPLDAALDAGAFEFSSTTNQAPAVSAGADSTITLPAAATLTGTASDDGLPNPPAALTRLWSKVSGPGTVTFADAAALQTTATFSTPGTYVIRLRADDGALQSSDDATVTVNPAAGTVPAAPANLTATGFSASQIDLAWTDQSSDEAEFILERSPDGTSGWTIVANPAANAVSHRDGPLTAATTYHYRIRASNASGQSANSNVATGTTFSDSTGGGGATPPVDTDGDGISDSDEAALGTNPNNAASKPGGSADFDGDGISDDTDSDADGDGASNSVETAAGTNPYNASSVATTPMTLLAISGGLNFAKAGKDYISVSTVLPQLPALFSPDKMTITLIAGGAAVPFVLDARGRSKSNGSSIALRLKGMKRNKQTKKMEFPGGDVGLKAMLRGSWQSSWIDEGLVNADTKTLVPFTVDAQLGGKVYRAEATVNYSAKAGKSGRFKK